MKQRAERSARRQRGRSRARSNAIESIISANTSHAPNQKPPAPRALATCYYYYHANSRPRIPQSSSLKGAKNARRSAFRPPLRDVRPCLLDDDEPEPFFFVRWRLARTHRRRWNTVRACAWAILVLTNVLVRAAARIVLLKPPTRERHAAHAHCPAVVVKAYTQWPCHVAC